MEDYQLVTATKDGKKYVHENSDFTPLSVSQFLRIVPPFCIRLDDTDVVRKISNRRLNGAEVRCIDFDTIRGAVSTAGEVCVLPSQPGASSQQTVLLSYKNNKLEFRWSEHEAFGGRMLPKRVQMMRDDTKLIEAVFKYEIQNPLHASIELPTGMKEVPSCQRSIPPAVKSSPDPVVPIGVPRIGHQVVVEVIVGTDGLVKASRVLESGTRGYDDAALEAVKKWTFLPKMCDGTPQEAHIHVQVNFRLH
jgi:TonB family protein